MKQVLISDYGVIQDPTREDQPLITPGISEPYRTYESWRKEYGYELNSPSSTTRSPKLFAEPQQYERSMSSSTRDHLLGRVFS